jgi:hypothetical protein
MISRRQNFKFKVKRERKNFAMIIRVAENYHFIARAGRVET